MPSSPHSDETMPIINKLEHSQKGKNKEQNGSTHVQEKSQREHQVPKPPPVMRSILNRERGGPLERMPTLEEPSLVATTRLKQRLPTHTITLLTPSTYKMCAKLKKEGF